MLLMLTFFVSTNLLASELAVDSQDNIDDAMFDIEEDKVTLDPKKWRYITQLKIGKSDVANQKYGGDYGSSVGFRFGAALSKQLVVGLEYNNTDVVDSARHSLSYMGPNITYHHWLNDAVSAYVGTGVGVKLTDNFSQDSEQETIRDAFPYLDIGFHYQLSERWRIGAGYRNAFRVTQANDSLNDVYMSLSFITAVNQPEPSPVIVPAPCPVCEEAPIPEPERELMTLAISYFDLNESQLPPIEEQKVNSIIRTIDSENGIEKVRANVNTDGSGIAESNEILSEQRGNYTHELIKRATTLDDDDIIIHTQVNDHSERFSRCMLIETGQKRADCLQQDRKLELILYPQE
ncbi:outer membrane beta-barrel protein [Vibrio hippocampi]|nr:outer membrane beta-barrel protein [Vibrio hippocampi]